MTAEAHYAAYVAKMRTARVWGGHLELMAAANALARPVHVFRDDAAAIQARDRAPYVRVLRVCPGGGMRPLAVYARLHFSRVRRLFGVYLEAVQTNVVRAAGPPHGAL